MADLPLFPKGIWLVIYATAIVAALAGAPALISHARQAAGPVMEEFGADQEGNVSAPAKASAKTEAISIQPVGRETEQRRRAELRALQAKLAVVPAK